MSKTRIVGLDTKKMAASMMAYVVKEQTDRLIAYAKDKVQSIGDSIAAYNSANHMDRTGNLLDSLCWGVIYNDRLYSYGYYREQQASVESHLHEWMANTEGLTRGDVMGMFPVYGHGLAEQFLANSEKYTSQFTSGNKGGWRVFFAILAPYWGYWEEGFTNAQTGKFMQWQVMTEYKDIVSQDLKGAKVYFKSVAPKYNTNKKNNLKSMFENMSRSPYKEKRHFKNIPRIKK